VACLFRLRHFIPALAILAALTQVGGLAKVEIVDPFVSREPEVEVDAETGRILKHRIRTAGEGHVVSAEEARQRIRQWLSKSATTKTR